MRVDDFLLISMNSDLGHLEDLEGGQLQLGNLPTLVTNHLHVLG